MPTLTDATIRKTKTGTKLKWLFDGGSTGLYKKFALSGAKLWRLKYWLNGKVKRLGLGACPDVSLLMARQHAAKARTLIADGIGPTRPQSGSGGAGGGSGHLRGRGA